jgi:toxin CcdB
MARFDVYANPGNHAASTPHLLETPKMGAIPQRVLQSRVTSLAQAQDQITAAVDFLFRGY